MTEPIPRFRTLTHEEQHSYEARHIRPSLVKCDDGNLVAYSDYAALAAENERLKASQLSLEKWIACEQVHFETANNLREKLYQASVQIERLRDAGDVLMQCYCAGDLVKEEWKQLPSVAQWLAAKEGRDAAKSGN